MLNNKGMSTIEAAVIIPFIVFVVAGFLFIGLYFVELSNVYKTIDEVVVYASMQIGKSRDLVTGNMDISYRNHSNLFDISHSNQEIKLKEMLQKELSQSRNRIRYQSLCVTMSSSNIKLSVELTLQDRLLELLGVRLFTHTYEKKYELGNATDTLRKRLAFLQSNNQANTY